VFLENCLNSVATCAAAFDTFIVDDNSDDPETQAVLKRWSAKYPALPSGDKGVEFKTGGLYPNMSEALRHAFSSGYEYAVFIQDDMQFIRQISDRDLEILDEYFRANEQSIQLETGFIKYGALVNDPKTFSPDASGIAMLRPSKPGFNKLNFAAAGTFSVARTIEFHGDFRIGEANNSVALRDKGFYYGWSMYPFMHWLPASISYRGKKRSLAHRFCEYIGGAGFHPIRIMDAEETEAFWNRSRSILPVAEHFLDCPTAPRKDLWAAGGGLLLVAGRGGWRAVGLSAIVGLKNALKSVLGKK
jgi:hypothetical protein